MGTKSGSLIALLGVFAAVFCAALAGTPAAFATARVALLIGNANYQNPDLVLGNPVNDAVGLAEALRPLGFEVTVLLDASKAQTNAELDAFAARADQAEMALFFYAGHGVQIDGENYLLTSGFEKLSAEEIARESVTLGDIQARISGAQPDVGLIVLDACRNNPFVESGQAVRGLARSMGGSGVLIAYATDPGNVAYDGVSENSYFTEALIDHIAEPAVEARLMFGRVRQQVALNTAGLQVPWVEESVLGEHFFNPDFRAAPKEAQISRDVQSWRSASAKGDQTAYRTYLDEFPEGLFRSFAEERIARLDTWNPASDELRGDQPAIQGADRERLAVALSTLGFLSQTRGQTESDPDLAAALAAYEQQMTDGGVAEFDRIYLDASQVMVVLGSTTAQRIRTDMAALKSIEITLDMAGRARMELAALAQTQEPARVALIAAEGDIDAIHAARAKVLDRLDQSRSYYAELVERGRKNFKPYLERSLAGLLEKARSTPAFEQGVVADADTFIRHATVLAEEKPEGSYAWIADFLPQDGQQN